MKIQRVNTLAFPISCKKEKKFQDDVGGKIKGKESKIIYGYAPLGKFKVIRPERVTKGWKRETEFISSSSFFYIDLNNLTVFYFNEEEGKLKSYDILKKISKLSEDAIKTLGYLMRYGESKKEELNKDAVMELAPLGLIKFFRPKLKELSALLIDELSPGSKHKTIVKERVKINFTLPKFADLGYNLGNFSDAEKEWIEEYSPLPIKHSLDKISRLLKRLFNAKTASPQAVVFLPFLEGKFKKSGKLTSLERKFPLLLSKEKDKDKKRGVALTPLALSTELGVAEPTPMERSTINFSNVANLEEVKEEIREEIIYPLIKPELAKKFGRRAGGGILLYGPPGCGKTFIVKAAIGECSSAFFNINLSELVSSGIDVGPKALHEIFEKAAREAPAVIFLDEIDAIGSTKTFTDAKHAVMLIDQLLMEMDGIESAKEKILFIAATNTPWAIDPALRRTERFTRQLFIPPPDKKTRVMLFRLYTKEEPLEENINFENLVDLTEGYASSDIEAICKSAAEIPWVEAMHGKKERKITQGDFLKALSKQKSSLIPWFKVAKREIEKTGELKLYEDLSNYILKYAGGVDRTEEATLTFQDVGDLEEVKEKIREKVIYPILHYQVTKEEKEKVGDGILLYGPPGCGKTYLAKGTMGETQASFFNVKISDVTLKENSEKKIQEIFERAERNAPAIIFFDEVDALLGRRKLSGQEKRILAQFLTEMDGFEEREGVFLIAATNTPWAIDPALRRAGRFTTQIFMPPPNLEAREEIFKIHLRNKKISDGVNFKKLARLTEGYASSDIGAVCSSLSKATSESQIEVKMGDFLIAIEGQKPSLIPWIKMAKRQLLESGEEDVYDEMLKNIAQLEKKFKEKEALGKILEEEKSKVGIISKEDKEKLRQLKNEKKQIEDLIETVKQKYYTRKIDEESFRKIVRDYEKKLIEIEMKIKESKR